MLTIILTKNDVQITNQSVPPFLSGSSSLAMRCIQREVKGLISFQNMIEANRYIYEHATAYRTVVQARIIDLRHETMCAYHAFHFSQLRLATAIWSKDMTGELTCEGLPLNRAETLDYPIFDLMTGKVVPFGRVYVKCADCGEWFYRGFSRQTRCEACKPQSKTCIVCGKKFMGTVNDLCCSDQCKRIKRDRIDTASIYSYFYKPACRFQTVSSGPSNEPSVGNLYLGFELEVAGSPDLDRETCAGIVQNLLPNTYCKYDGSVDDGFEIVSHPGTLAFHQKNGARFRKAMRILTGLKFENENRQCGLHVHVNREFLRNKGAAIAKLVCLSDRFYDELMTFARRPAGSQHWCRKNGDVYRCATREDYTIRYRYSYHPGERYLAINLQNRNTVEFRIFHSTMDWQTFIASLQLVDTMVRYACTHKWREVMSCSFADMTASNHKELNEYLARLNLVPHFALAA